MKQRLFLVCLLLMPSVVFAQSKIPANQIHPSMGFGGTTGGLITNENLDANGPLGSIYYTDKWMIGAISSTGKMLHENLYFKYNIQTQSLVIKLDEEKVKTVHNRFVASFEFTDQIGRVHQFGNAKGYTLEGVPLVGFVEYLYKGNFELIYRYSIRLKPGDNNPYGMGMRSPEYMKRVQLMLADENKDIFYVKSKKELLPYFGEKSEEMKTYFRKNKVNLKKYDAIEKMMNYYKSL